MKWALSNRDWKGFVEMYPDKAKAYADAGHAQIKMELAVKKGLEDATSNFPVPDTLPEYH